MEGSSSRVPLWDEAQQNTPPLGDHYVIDSEKHSLYVKMFQNIQGVVMEHERFLFSAEEQAIFAKFNSLTYNAQYLFTRLCLCKRGKWHTLSSLEQRYISELGDKQFILQAIDELCGKCNNLKQENNGAFTAIDLTSSDDEQDIPASIMEAPFSKDSSALAEDETAASLEELLESLTAGTLKELAKQLNILKPRKTRLELIQAILTQSTNQSTLVFPVLNEHGRCKMTVGRQSIKVTGSRTTQAKVVRLQVLKVLDRCIRIPNSIFSVIDLLNILFFRSTEYISSLFLPALLSSFKKRYYAPVEYSRTPNIFPDRQTLLNYQDALVLESKLDEALSLFSEGSPLDNRPERAKVVKGIWEDAYNRWKDVVLNHDNKMRNPLFSRYHPGHVLTRIVHRGLDIISTLKDYTTEIEVLKALLGQTIWGVGRRGAWYDRLALILMKYSGDSVQSLEASIDVVILALEDENTHLIYRPRLQRRLTRLESKLKIPLENRHQCIRKLRDAENVYIKGVRVRNPEQFNIPSSRTWFSNLDSQITSLSMKGKTLWVGNDGVQISVEQFALQYYSTLGYRGLHSEGRVIATLFGLLFWDIIFSRIPGAFETPFQSAPLDMFDGTFYIARKECIENRLQTLRDGGGKEILESVVIRESAQRTVCIGVDWEFETKDLLDIVDYMRGDVIATICQMISEDYGRWRAGVPDLLIWNSDLQECKFVEVKSANDTLQENQKVWIDILLGAGAIVELCHILESGPKLSTKANSGKRPKNHEIESDYDGEPVIPKKEKKQKE